MSQMKELPQVGFSEAAQSFFKKCFQFKGRIRRSEYWWGALTVAIASAVLSLIPFVGWVALIFLAIGGISMLFRRLHDTGRSGWWWGCQTIIGLVAGALFFSAIDFHAYMMAAQSQDATEMMRVLSAGMTGGAGIFALLLYLVNGALGIVIFVFTLLDSKPEANKYGESPKYVVEQTEG